jgi:DNA-binding CsgD family transcriptional regulator
MRERVNVSEEICLLMTNVPADQWSACLGQEHQSLGRSRHAQIRLPEQFRYVSRMHAEVWVDAKGCWLRDLGSTAGTRVNGVWLKRDMAVRLMPGDRLWLGGAVLDVVIRKRKSSDATEITRFDLASTEDTAADGTRTVDPVALNAKLIPSAERRREIEDLMARVRQVTPAEREILMWIQRGFVTDEELGEVLSRSPNTVRTQVTSIYTKLGMNSRVDLIRLSCRFAEYEAIIARDESDGSGV